MLRLQRRGAGRNPTSPPESSEEIAESVGGAYDADASMVHVHARPEVSYAPGDDHRGLARRQHAHPCAAPRSSSTTPPVVGRG
ncbi:MAG: 3-keto-5-aminohexanoate cleavage protein [Gemmatimonadetes bacterium]|nr:3-keto-5-aminohexanoate cleavage protein [Gemmatimonadota bacterium]